MPQCDQPSQFVPTQVEPKAQTSLPAPLSWRQNLRFLVRRNTIQSGKACRGTSSAVHESFYGALTQCPKGDILPQAPLPLAQLLFDPPRLPSLHCKAIVADTNWCFFRLRGVAYQFPCRITMTVFVFPHFDASPNASQLYPTH